jgi:hypothetical protein
MLKLVLAVASTISSRRPSVRGPLRFGAPMTRIKKTISVLVQVLGVLLPAGAKRFLFRHVLGWMVGEDVRFGCSVLLRLLGRNTGR